MSRQQKEKLDDIGLLNPTMFSDLGDLCKAREVELRSLDVVPAGSHFVIRVDGRSFSKFTKSFAKPFDDLIAHAMSVAAQIVCKDLRCAFAYTESDEITYVFKSKGTENFQHTFGGKVAKLLSTCAALTSVAFYKALVERVPHVSQSFPHFDARLVDVIDVSQPATRILRAVVWRQNDAIRNSVSMVAQSVMSHGELQGVNTPGKLELLDEFCSARNITNWWQYSSRHTKGTFVCPKTVEREFTEQELHSIPEHCRPDPGARFTRTSWECVVRERLMTKPGTDYTFDDEDAFSIGEATATLQSLGW